jgi:putative membrane protein
MTEREKRRPRAFKVDDPALSEADDVWVEETPPADPGGPEAKGGFALPTRAELADGFKWGSLFVSAMIGLTTLALGVWFARFISAALASEGVVGWLAMSLTVLLCIAGLVLAVRELYGFRKLQKLETLRDDVEAARATEDISRERKVAASVVRLYADRPELRWQLENLREHQNDINDPGDLLRLVDRDLLTALDADVRQVIMRSARRVSMVTALSPIVIIDVVFVFFESIRMLRGIAAIYGGRPGFLGGLRLGRMVLTNLIAAGGIALTDDLLGQFLGQDLVRRVSRKLGEGLFNGALTARIGVAAVEIVRPVPHLDSTPVRARDVIRELFRRSPVTEHEPAGTANTPRGGA